MSSTQYQHSDIHPWRAAAPRARRATMALYAWREPGHGFIFSLVVALAFVVLCAASPALLSLTPTLEMIGPVAQARAIGAGAIDLSTTSAPFHVLLLQLADLAADTPGRIHLLSKAIAAALLAMPLAYLLSVRFPTAQTILFSAAMAAFICAPFAGAGDIALTYYIAFAVVTLCAPADEARFRAVIEGIIGAFLLFALWMMNPVISLLGFLTLAACPFVSGRRGLDRYFSILLFFAALVGVTELLFSGLNIARADAVTTAILQTGDMVTSSGLGLVGIAVSTAIVIFSAAIFGGRAHWRGWGVAAVFLALSSIAAHLAGANAMPLFALAAAIACLSVASPFYDGIFRAHDRASISVSASVAALTLFWTAALVVHATSQFALQYRVAKTASQEIVAELGLVQPGGSQIAQWIEEGRFSTPEARELLALAPVDQSMMLLEAAAHAKRFENAGADVAILTAADTACVINAFRKCVSDGNAAASTANIILVPRIDLSTATSAVKAKAEVLLYTEFKMVNQTPFWDVWVRRENGAQFSGAISALN